MLPWTDRLVAAGGTQRHEHHPERSCYCAVARRRRSHQAVAPPASAAATASAAISHPVLLPADWSAAGVMALDGPDSGVLTLLDVGPGEAEVTDVVGAGVVRGADRDACVADVPPPGRLPGGGTLFGGGYVVGAGWSTVTVKIVRAVVLGVPCVAAIVTCPGRLEPGMRTSRLNDPSARTVAVSTFNDATDNVTGPHVVQNERPTSLTVVSGGP
jgi:hypothetical protein